MAYGGGAVISSFVARPIMDRDFARVAEKAAKNAQPDAEHAVGDWMFSGIEQDADLL